jgi:hypothetical protein
MVWLNCKLKIATLEAHNLAFSNVPKTIYQLGGECGLGSKKKEIIIICEPRNINFI